MEALPAERWSPAEMKAGDGGGVAGGGGGGGGASSAVAAISGMISSITAAVHVPAAVSALIITVAVLLGVNAGCGGTAAASVSCAWPNSWQQQGCLACSCLLAAGLSIWLWFAQGVLKAYAVAQLRKPGGRPSQSLPSSSALHTPSSPCSLSWRCSMGCNKRLGTL